MLVLDYIGYLGPIITCLFTVLLFFPDKLLLVSYLILFIIFQCVTRYLRIAIIRQPRPENQKPIKICGKTYIGEPCCGMPSGHLHACFFNTAFIYFALHDNWITFTYLIFSLSTFWQRFCYNNHTFSQIITGVLFGIFTGSLSWCIFTMLIQNYRGG